MALEWTHDGQTCPLAGCAGNKDCLYFPTPEDRMNMAEAAFQEYAEADGNSFDDFCRDVQLLAEQRYSMKVALNLQPSQPGVNLNVVERNDLIEPLYQYRRLLRRQKLFGLADAARALLESLGYDVVRRDRRQ